MNKVVILFVWFSALLFCDGYIYAASENIQPGSSEVASEEGHKDGDSSSPESDSEVENPFNKFFCKFKNLCSDQDELKKDLDDFWVMIVGLDKKLKDQNFSLQGDLVSCIGKMCEVLWSGLSGEGYNRYLEYHNNFLKSLDFARLNWLCVVDRFERVPNCAVAISEKIVPLERAEIEKWKKLCDDYGRIRFFGRLEFLISIYDVLSVYTGFRRHSLWKF